MECRGKKVLVAEDYVSNRNLLACLLEQAQYEVHLAGDGYEALEPHVQWGVRCRHYSGWSHARIQ